LVSPLTADVHTGQAEEMAVLEHPIEFFGVDALQDPYPLYDRLRAERPVHRVGESGFHLVCDWAAINDAIKRPEDFSANLTATMTFTADGAVVPFEMDGLGGPTHVLATADDPAHAVHRKMLVHQLAAKRIRAMEPFIANTFDRLWTDGLRDGHIEWMGVLANRLPMMVVARLIGVPAADVDQLVRWAYASTELLDGLVDQEQLAACQEETELVKVTGYIGRPEFARKTRGEQFLFVNNRFIRSNYLHHAVMGAFEGLLPENSFPFYVLFMEIDPRHIDVNIHPTKTEVKFDDERAVYAVMRSAVKQALGANPAPFFRFPALVHTPATTDYLGARNIAMFSCDVDSNDFKSSSSEQVISNVMTKLDKQGKGVILMHDLQKHTAIALPTLLRRLKAGGYKVVQMKAKTPLETLPEYDAMMVKDLKVPAVSSRAIGSVVQTVSD